MGTKNNPGSYDCYEAADPDEPMFILLGRDPIAPLLVELWAKLKSKLDGYGPDGYGTDQVREARQVAHAMATYCENTRGKLGATRRRLVQLLFEQR